MTDELKTEPANDLVNRHAPIEAFDNGERVYLDSYSGGAAPEGVFGSLTLLFVAPDGTETRRRYRADHFPDTGKIVPLNHNPHILEELRGFYLRGEKGTRYAGKERKDILYLLGYIEALEARVEAAGLGVRHD